MTDQDRRQRANQLLVELHEMFARQPWDADNIIIHIMDYTRDTARRQREADINILRGHVDLNWQGIDAALYLIGQLEAETEGWRGGQGG